MPLRIVMMVLLLLGACAHRPSAGEKAVANAIEDVLDNAEAAAADLSLGDNVETVEAGPRDPMERLPVPTINYFPAALAEPGTLCRYDEGRPQPILSEFERRWYSQHLAAAGEQSLSLASQNLTDGKRSLRFTWLPTFDRPVIVRVDTMRSGEARLSAVMLSGAGGYDPGIVEKRIDRLLTAEEARKLKAALERSRLFLLPPKICDAGADGAQWIFEAADAGGYHFLDRWTPRKGPARKVGMLMLSLTGWKFESVY